jgi:hypothetical protein
MRCRGVGGDGPCAAVDEESGIARGWSGHPSNGKTAG